MNNLPDRTPRPRVFLSYARGDDEPFVRRLHAGLVQAGFRVWFDRESLMSRGLSFHQEIKDAIRTEVDRLVYVGGPKAALSAYVREEWQFALECDHVVVTPILRLGGSGNVPGELRLLHCEDFREDAHYPRALAKLIADLRQPNPPLGALFAVPSLPPNFLGRPDLMGRVRDALLVDLQKAQVITGADARVGMQGMGGIGKSVLAAALARNRQVRQAYPDGIAWISCGQGLSDDDLLARQRDLAHHLGNEATFAALAQGQAVLRDLLAPKAVLLVLDDVWRAADARAFDLLGPRGRLLVTTRDKGILDSLHGELVPVSLFTDAEARQLLADAVGIAPADLPAEGHEVARECGNLPLALALCGGMASKRGGDFHSVLERLRRADLEKITDRQSINAQHRSLWRAMQASVEVLSDDEQRRFAELAVFATDQTVPAAAAATLWSYTGDLDDLDAEDLLVELAGRSLVQLDQETEADGQVQRRFRLHDLLHDYAVRIAGEPRAVHQILLDAYRRYCPDGWHTGPDDGYFLQRLRHHLLAIERWDDLENILTNLEFVAVRSTAGGTYDLLDDYTAVLDAWPDGDATKSEWRAGPDLACYRDNLLRFARGDAPIFAPVPSKVPESRDATGMATGETLVDPKRRIDAYRQFVRSHAHILSKWRCGRDLVLQLAFNSACGSPVSLSAECIILASPGRRLLQPPHLRRPWNPTPGLIGTFEAHAEPVKALEFSADGRHLLSLGGDRATLWEITRRDRLEAHPIALPPDFKDVRSARASADAARLVAVNSHGLLVATPDGMSERRIPTEGIGLGLVITAAARWAATYDERVFHEWDLGAGTQHQSVSTQSAHIDAIAMSADGRRIITAHHDLIVRLHDLAGGAPPVSASLVADLFAKRVMRFSRDHRLLVAYTRDSKAFLDVLGQSGVWEVSVPLGDDEIGCLAVTADGSQAFVGQDNGTIQCFDLSTCVCIRVFRTECETPWFVALRRRDSQLVVLSYSYGYVATEIWTLATGQCLHQLVAKNDRPWTPKALLPNGDTLVVTRADHDHGCENTLALQDLRSGRLVRTLGPWEEASEEVMVPQDGRRILAGSWQHGIQQWSVNGRTPPHSLGEDGCTLRNFHADSVGAIGLSSRDDTPLRLWNLRTKQCLREIPALSDWGAEVCVSSDARVAASCENEFVLRSWDGAPGESRIQASRLTGHRSVISDLAITPDGATCLSGSWDKTIHVWDLATSTARILSGCDGDVKSVAASADGTIGASWSTSWAKDGALRVWNLEAGRQIKVLDMNMESVESLCMSADGGLVASGDRHGCIKLWDVQSGQLDQRRRRHNSSVGKVCLLPGGTRLASCAGDGTVGIWDLSGSTPDAILSATTGEPEIVDVIVPLVSGFASAGQDGRICLWNETVRECVGVLVLESYDMLYSDCNRAHLAAPADGSFLVSASDLDGDLRVWDIARRKCIHSIRVHESGVDAIALSAGGRTVATFSTTTAKESLYTMNLWDLSDARSLQTSLVTASVWSAQFTPRGDCVLVTGGNVIELWNVMRGKRVWSISGDLAALSPTGDEVVVAFANLVFRVDLSSGSVISTIRGHGTRLSDLQVTPDGNWLVSAGQDRTIRVWSLDSGECVSMDVLESEPRTLSRIAASGLFACGTESGEILVRQPSGIEIGPCLVTPVRRWMHGERPQWDERLVVRCPECAHIAIADDFSNRRPAPCENCGTMLVLTPFVVDVS